MTVTGYVLAGGRSRRMGRDKAWLDVRGRPMIAWTLDRLRQAADRVAVVGGGAQADRLKALGVEEILADDRPGEGPLAAVETGLRAAATDLCVFVPCDMPRLAPRLIGILARACAAGAPVAASMHPLEGVQPFPLVCRRDAAPAVEALLDRGERALRALLTLSGAHVERVEDASLWPSFVNVNTEADYAALAG